ncbi:class II aldolase/adducin family protein [Eubacteriales bacterium KG127]
MNRRQQLINIARKLVEKNLVVRTWGNMSLREDENHILITPSGIRYEDLVEENIVKVNIITGEKVMINVESDQEASSELPVHLAYYRQKPATQVVLHTHQMYGTAMSLYGRNIPVTENLRKIIDCSFVPVSPYGISGSKKLHDNVSETIKETGSRLVLMAKHGVLAAGDRVDEAFIIVEELEKWAANMYAKITEYPAVELDCINVIEEKDNLFCHDDMATKEILNNKCLPEKQKRFTLSMRSAEIEGILQNPIINAYVDDFAQICGEKISTARGNMDAVICLENKTVKLYGNNLQDIAAAAHVLDKNLKAREIAIRKNVCPLSDEDAKIMRKKYLNVYSIKADRV